MRRILLRTLTIALVAATTLLCYAGVAEAGLRINTN